MTVHTQSIQSENHATDIYQHCWNMFKRMSLVRPKVSDAAAMQS